MSISMLNKSLTLIVRKHWNFFSIDTIFLIHLLVKLLRSFHLNPQKISNWTEMVLHSKYFFKFWLFFCDDPETRKSKFPKVLQVIWNLYTSLKRFQCIYFQKRTQFWQLSGDQLQNLKILEFVIFCSFWFIKTYNFHFKYSKFNTS